MASLISTLTDTSVYAELHTHSVYKLTNPELNRVYYGCTSTTVEDRFEGHMYELNDGVHHNRLFQGLFDAGYKDWTVEKVATGFKDEMFSLESTLYTNDKHSINLGNSNRVRPPVVTYDEVQLVKTLHAQGFSNRKIAARLDRSRATISYILTGKYENLNHTN